MTNFWGGYDFEANSHPLTGQPCFGYEEETCAKSEVPRVGAKPSYSVRDWLNLHEFATSEALEWCRAITNPFQQGKLRSITDRGESTSSLRIEECLEHLIVPSLSAFLGISGKSANPFSDVKVVQYDPDYLELPYTEHCENSDSPSVHLSWSGRVDDLMCLAHEMAHAAQMVLSKNGLMPPVAREICAFLGELGLIRYVQKSDPALYQDLQRVWQRENAVYLGTDAFALIDALEVPSTPYTYRQNYPIARFASICLFSSLSTDRAQALFASGTDAMEQFCNRSKLYGFIQEFGAQRAGEDYITAEHATSYSHNEHAVSESAETLRLSLSPKAYDRVRAAKLNPDRIDQVASLGVVSRSGKMQGHEHIPRQSWVKWRSLGTLALIALHEGKANMRPDEFLAAYERDASRLPHPKIPYEFPWVQSKDFDVLTALGMIIQQLAQSPYHKQFTLSDYLPIEILPPLELGQIRCYVDVNGSPVGVVSWAFLSDETKEEVHVTGRALIEDEWSNGENLFMNDWITEPEVFKPIMNEMRGVIFPNHIASSLRRAVDGSVRRVNVWTGRNLQKMQVLEKSKITAPFERK